MQAVSPVAGAAALTHEMLDTWTAGLQTPPFLPDANRVAPSRVYPANDTDPALTIELPVPGYEHRDLDDVAATLRITAVGHAERLLRQNRTSVPYVVVDVPGWVFAIRRTRCLHSYEIYGMAARLHCAPECTLAACRAFYFCHVQVNDPHAHSCIEPLRDVMLWDMPCLQRAAAGVADREQPAVCTGPEAAGSAHRQQGQRYRVQRAPPAGGGGHVRVHRGRRRSRGVSSHAVAQPIKCCGRLLDQCTYVKHYACQCEALSNEIGSCMHAANVCQVR
jgi:hypothetical protein